VKLSYLAAAVGLFVSASTALAKPDGMKVVVQDLDARGVATHEAATIATAACTELAKRQKLSVLCGDDLRAMLKWNAMASSFNACKEDACMQTAAKAMEAKYVVSGSVAKVGEGFVLTLSMLDVETGTALGRTEVKAQSIDQLHKEVDEAVGSLLKEKK
jgi:TolB-like protein